jgi:two-component system, NarL family, sensor histidine kinase LiaS
LRGVDHEYRLEIKDDGCGFDQLFERQHRGGIGLESMRERVNRIGGELNIDSQFGNGTQVTIILKK